MTQAPTDLRSIVVEREIPLAPETIWNALTKADLIREWLMDNDFELKLGYEFNFRAEPMFGWKGVTDCEVLEIEPLERLRYSWNASGEQAEGGLKSVVTWTLTGVENGTLVRMDHYGFRPQDEGGYQAMGSGWPQIVARLEEVSAKAM